MTGLQKFYLSLGIIAGVVIITLSTIVGVCWEYIQGTILGKTYYTEEQLNDKYEDGYNDANFDKEESDKIISEYKLQLAESQSEVSTLTVKISGLEEQNKEYQTQVTNLTESRDNALLEKSNLELENAEIEEELSQANAELVITQDKLELAQDQNSLNLSEIENLQNRVNKLNEYIAEIEEVYTSNLSTISNLNSQIMVISKQVIDLTTQIESNNQLINTYQSKITKLENSISYYENFISQLINENKVLAIFEFDNEVYSIQVVDKNGYAESLTPSSIDTATFNYWTVDGEQVDVSTYQLTNNTKFIANITYKYKVDFVVEGEEFDSVQYVIENGFATEPVEVPVSTQEHYEFAGWSINGTDIVDIESFPIISNTTFYAVFELEKVTVNVVSDLFMGSTLYSEELEYNSLLNSLNYTPISTEEKPEDYRFKYYETGNFLSPTQIDLTTFRVTEDISICPVFENYVSYVTVYDGEEKIFSQRVEKGTIVDLSSVEPLGHEGYRFVGFYGSFYFESQGSSDKLKVVNDFPTLSSIVCTSDSYSCSAHYEKLSDGYFTCSDAPLDLNKLYIGYSISGEDLQHGVVKNNSLTSLRFPKVDPSLDGTFVLEISGASYYLVGSYDEETDSWKFLAYKTDTDERYEIRDFTMVRSGYSIGTPFDLINTETESLVA